MTLMQATLRWRWRRVGGSKVAHLVPGRILARSRTACNRLPVTAEDMLETPVGLLTEVELCASCAKAAR